MRLAYRLDGTERLDLKDVDPDETAGLSKPEAEQRLARLGVEWGELEDLLFYSGKHALLIVLQGRDTSGKDGAIRCLLEYSNAQSCRVESFKVPTAEERAHDFLWRVHARAPARGSAVIFNRSHYEDVLVVRVHELAPEKTWRRRYAQINQFEELLHESGTILVKFYLHISKNEQEERLLARERETEKAWKLSVGDWKEREYWDDYTAAYEEALNRCSRPHAPWIVVPANRKWFRNLALMENLVDTLRPYREEWLAHLQEVGSRAREELRQYRQTGA